MRFIDVLQSRNGQPVDFKEIEPQIHELAKEFCLELFYIFGSYAFNNASKLSDLDIAVLSRRGISFKKWLSLLERLQRLFKDEAIDLVDLRMAPLTLIHRVLKEGRCLYAKDLTTKIDFETKYESFYFDTAPLRREYDFYLLRRIEDGTFGHRQGKA